MRSATHVTSPVRDPNRPTEDADMRRATPVLSYHQTVESRFSISSIGLV